MKRTLLYFTPFLLAALLAACTKNPVVPTVLAPTFKGVYGGKYVHLHENLKTGKIDTTISNITLTLDSLGRFSVTGDTSKYHAGSHGTFALGYSSDLIFSDKTAPASGVATTKAHLDGDYAYAASGAILNLLKNVGDSVSYQYFLTRTTN